MLEHAHNQPKFNDIAFNNDGSCISVATNNGFKVYNTYPLECKLIQTFDTDSNNRRKGLGLARMLNRSNYIALCGGGKDPRYPLNKLIIWDDLYGKESITLSFMSMVRDVFLTRCHIVVVLDDKVSLYSFSKQPVKLIDDLEIPFGSRVDFRTLTLEDTRYGNEACGIICFESPVRRGQVHIATLRDMPAVPGSTFAYNKDNTNESATATTTTTTNATSEIRHKLALSTTIIRAHKSEIQLIRLNRQGTMVATCSKKGTIIRVFNVHNGALIREFRRGIDNAEVYAMEFSPRGSKLAVVSSKQTLHIFEISHTVSQEVIDDKGKGKGTEGLERERDNNRRTLLSSIVPKSLSIGYLDSVWSMCKVNLVPPVTNLARLGQRGDNGNGEFSSEFLSDRCKISWCTSGSKVTTSEETANISQAGREGGRNRTVGDKGETVQENEEKGEEDEDSLILVWKNSGIWEKYVILEKTDVNSPVTHEGKYYAVNESLRGDYLDGNDPSGDGPHNSGGIMDQNGTGEEREKRRIRKKKREWEIVRESWREL